MDISGSGFRASQYNSHDPISNKVPAADKRGERLMSGGAEQQIKQHSYGLEMKYSA